MNNAEFDAYERRLKRTNIILCALNHLHSSLKSGHSLAYLDEIIAVETIEPDEINAICESLNFGETTEDAVARSFVVAGRVGQGTCAVRIVEAQTAAIAAERFERELLGDHPGDVELQYCEPLSVALEDRLVVPFTLFAHAG